MTPFIYTFQNQEIEIHPRLHKQAKRLNIRFDSLRSLIILTLPPRATKRHMADFLKQSEGWIHKKISEKNIAVPFKNGRVIPVLGERLTLNHQGLYTLRDVKIEKDILTVCGPERQLNTMVTLFLKRYAQEKFTRICEDYAKQIGKEIHKITIRNQKSRWGSCSSQGNISLSWRLLFAPYDVATYVCAHEVAHLKEMNHSVHFWKIVAEMSPYYKESLKWLKKYGHTLFKYGVL